MIAGTLTLLTFVSVVLFPWPLATLLACMCAFSVPLLPLAAGLFFDALYYAPQTGELPLFTIGGVLVTTLALLVRTRLNTSIIGR